MKFSIDKKIFEKFLGVEIGVLVITGMDNYGHNQDILSLLRSEEKKQKEKLTGVELGSLPEVAVWRKIYQEFGSNRDYRSSVEALLRRARGGEKPLPQINNLVDLYNYLSLKYHLPAGAEDIDKVEGDISLTFADGTEKGVYIGGDKEENCDKGEVVYKDKAGFICRRWNWREADRTKIDFETVNAVLVLEKAPGLDKTVFSASLEEARELILKHLHGKCQLSVLFADTPSLETEFKTGKKKEASFCHSRESGNLKKIPDRVGDDRKNTPKFPKIIVDDPYSLTFQLRYLICQALQDILGEIGREVEFSSILVEHPINKSYGDYSTNIAMILAKRLGMRPIDLSNEIKRKIDEYIGGDQSITVKADSFRTKDIVIKPKDILEKNYTVLPGFLNMVVATKNLISQMSRLLENEDAVRITQMKGKKIAVEYTDPNPFKEFHLGHLYSNAIGESISRLFEACGAVVWRGDFYGDVGMHVAKSVWGMLEKLKNQSLSSRPSQSDWRVEGSSTFRKLEPARNVAHSAAGGDSSTTLGMTPLKQAIKTLEKLPLNKRMKFLGQGYALGTIKYEEDKHVQEEVKNINSLIYVAAQEILKKNKGWHPIIDYKQHVYGKEDRLREVREVYGAGLKWSLEYFEDIYKKLGTKFDGYYPESWVGEYGMKLVEKGLKMGVLEKSEGGVIYRGEQDGLHTRVFVNKLGLPTYEAKDLGLAQAKYQDFQYDLSINVFGKEIDEYYKVVKAALIRIEPELGKRAFHIAHGMVKLPAGKMSSRSGNVVTFEWLLDEAKKRVLEIIKNSVRKANSGQDTSNNFAEVAKPFSAPPKEAVGVLKSLRSPQNFQSNEMNEIAEKVALGAVKYALLKSNIGNDVVFDFDKSLSFEGDSGPYLMYTYARCRSVMRKSGLSALSPKSLKLLRSLKEINEEEKTLLRLFYRFPEVVVEAIRTFSPNLLCSYLYDLAQTYNLFYQKHSILNLESRTKNVEQISAKDTSDGNIVLRHLGGDRMGSPEVEGSDKTIIFRLSLTTATAKILKKGLILLGIKTIEKM